jgi:undecaprenyl-diphosphatase
MGPRTVIPVLCATVALGETARRARTKQVDSREERLFRAVNGAPERLRGPAWLVMQAGSLGAVFGVAWLLRPCGDSRAERALVAGTAAWSGAKLMKPLVGRGRPADHIGNVNIRGGAQSGSGYPSGHAAVAATLALVATPSGGRPRVVAAGWALATGIARMYVGAHLPLDVVGGLAVGVIIASAAGGDLAG